MTPRLRQTALVAVVAVLLLGSALTAGVAGAAVQENESGPESDGDREGEDGLEVNDEQEEPTTVVEQVDDDVRVLEWHYDDENETFWVTIENTGSSSTMLTITENVDPEQDGSGSFGVQQRRIGAEETLEIGVDATKHRGTVGVMITTPASLDRGQGTFLQESDGFSVGLFDGAATWTDVRVAVGATVVTSIVVLVIGAWYIVRSRDLDVMEVNLGA